MLKPTIKSGHEKSKRSFVTAIKKYFFCNSLTEDSAEVTPFNDLLNPNGKVAAVCLRANLIQSNTLENVMKISLKLHATMIFEISTFPTITAKYNI